MWKFRHLLQPSLPSYSLMNPPRFRRLLVSEIYYERRRAWHPISIVRSRHCRPVSLDFWKSGMRSSAHIDAYKTVLHPIRSLPFDVFQHIFQHCVVELADCMLEAYQSPMPKCSQVLINRTSSLDTKKSPWLLAQVSRHWRDVVLGCPTLWSSLTVEIPKKGEWPGLLSLISLQLQRSRGTPLSMVVINIHSEISSPLIAFLCSHSSRWQLFCALAPPKTLATFASFLHGSLPILEYLSIKASVRHRTEWSQLQMRPLLHAFQSCYRLRWFRAVDIPQVLSISLPWGQITEISNTHYKSLAKDFSNRENLATLRQAKNLQFAKICGSFDTSPTFSPNSLLSHSRLRGLHLQSGCKAVQDVIQLIDCLVLPALQELVVCVGAAPVAASIVDDGSILRFLKRSSPPLETLILQDIVMSYTTIMEVFTALPKLRVVGIYGITKQVLQALHWPQQSTARVEEVLPKLEQLRLYGPETDIDQNTLVGMIESRFEPQGSTNTVVNASSGAWHPQCSSLALVQTAKPLRIH
ncbi:hypothetical protein BT96DRAFT_277560 [Gymnopus androsaceus JB14]|uniref:Uncharacterized protein n=1 Tax=Gymnopus androsaceus JB14 TaxID=1447944 RepID=A0A6A4H3C2_9AGAR|nr:hypothetical protein BT96DRAFT_277560 [Gymnopus androsaceus JB14]